MLIIQRVPKNLR